MTPLSGAWYRNPCSSWNELGPTCLRTTSGSPGFSSSSVKNGIDNPAGSLHFCDDTCPQICGLATGGAMSRKRHWTGVVGVVALAAGVALMVAAYGVAATHSKAAPKKSQAFGQLRAVIDTVDYLDPQQAYTGQARWAMWNVYETLLTYKHVEGA